MDEHNVNENVLEELLKQGLTARKIQDCYERYVWHVNYYESKLKAIEEELKRYKDKFGELEG